MVRARASAVYVDRSGDVTQTCLRLGSSERAGQNHWGPIFLAAFSRRTVTASLPTR